MKVFLCVMGILIFCLFLFMAMVMRDQKEYDETVGADEDQT